jgi:hypothetical protein
MIIVIGKRIRCIIPQTNSSESRQSRQCSAAWCKGSEQQLAQQQQDCSQSSLRLMHSHSRRAQCRSELQQQQQQQQRRIGTSVAEHEAVLACPL